MKLSTSGLFFFICDRSMESMENMFMFKEKTCSSWWTFNLRISDVTDDRSKYQLNIRHCVTFDDFKL